jgi:hypothetical protein
MLQPDKETVDSIIRPMRFACRINKSRIDTLIICNIYRFSTATVVAMNVPQYYIACPVIDFPRCLCAITGIVTQNIPRLEYTRF